MNRRPTWFWPTALGAVVLAACASSPPPRQHAMSLPPARALAATGPALAVAPVRVPEALDRVQMVVTEADGRLTVRDDIRWAQPYKLELSSALAAHLAERSGSARVLPASAATPASARLSVELLRADTRHDGLVTLEAACTLTRTGQEAQQARILLQATGGTAAEALVATHGELAARLATEVLVRWPEFGASR